MQTYERSVHIYWSLITSLVGHMVALIYYNYFRIIIYITVQNLVYGSAKNVVFIFDQLVGSMQFTVDGIFAFPDSYTKHYIMCILWNVCRIQNFSTKDEMTCQSTQYWVSKNTRVDVLVSLRRRHQIEWRS